jgi:membrane dipeptidase
LSVFVPDLKVRAIKDFANQNVHSNGNHVLRNMCKARSPFPTLLLLILILLTACTPGKHAMKPPEPTYEQAVAMAHRYIITDGHIDLPYRLRVKNFRLEREFLGIPIDTKDGDFDYVRAKAGGLTAPFMSIFIPSSYQADLDSAKQLADSIIAMMDGIIEAHPDKFGRGGSPEQIDSNFKKGLISLPMGLENGAPIKTLDDLQYYYDKGIRYVTLTHAKDNHICDSSYDTTRTWNGLSPYGRALIPAMNKVGMMVDVSHISDAAFFQVMELSKAPVIASHSSCRKFTPGWERNMSDEMIKLLASRDGVIQINFGSTFLDSEIAKNRDRYREALNERLSKAGLKADEDAAKPLIEKFKKDYPALYSDVERVVDHIDHVRDIAGIDYVGLGSDYDGVGDSLPVGLKDVSMYPNLIHELLKRGYSESDIAKICYQNVWRVWHKVNEVASSR